MGGGEWCSRKARIQEVQGKAFICYKIQSKIKKSLSFLQMNFNKIIQNYLTSPEKKSMICRFLFGSFFISTRIKRCM